MVSNIRFLVTYILMLIAPIANSASVEHKYSFMPVNQQSPFTKFNGDSYNKFNGQLFKLIKLPAVYDQNYSGQKASTEWDKDDPKMGAVPADQSQSLQNLPANPKIDVYPIAKRLEFNNGASPKQNLEQNSRVIQNKERKGPFDIRNKTLQISKTIFKINNIQSDIPQMIDNTSRNSQDVAEVREDNSSSQKPVFKSQYLKFQSVPLKDNEIKTKDNVVNNIPTQPACIKYFQNNNLYKQYIENMQPTNENDLKGTQKSSKNKNVSRLPNNMSLSSQSSDDGESFSKNLDVNPHNDHILPEIPKRQYLQMFNQKQSHPELQESKQSYYQTNDLPNIKTDKKQSFDNPQPAKETSPNLEEQNTSSLLKKTVKEVPPNHTYLEDSKKSSEFPKVYVNMFTRPKTWHESSGNIKKYNSFKDQQLKTPYSNEIHTASQNFQQKDERTSKLPIFPKVFVNSLNKLQTPDFSNESGMQQSPPNSNASPATIKRINNRYFSDGKSKEEEVQKPEMNEYDPGQFRYNIGSQEGEEDLEPKFYNAQQSMSNMYRWILLLPKEPEMNLPLNFGNHDSAGQLMVIPNQEYAYPQAPLADYDLPLDREVAVSNFVFPKEFQQVYYVDT